MQAYVAALVTYTYMHSVLFEVFSFFSLVVGSARQRWLPMHTRHPLPIHFSLLPLSRQRHAATQCRGQASHPTRVQSTHTQSLLRRSCCSPLHRRRSTGRLSLASAMGWNSSVTAAQGGRRKTKRTQQQRGAATCTHTYPSRQPCAQGGALHRTPSIGARKDGQRGLPPDAAPLRQRGAGSEAEERQEAYSRRV